MIELLSTKLFIPRPRKNLVSRLCLVDRLNAGLDKKLTLIAAPAGFGKTTLLSEWIPQSPRCVTWLSLDHGDNDPVKFWAYFIASLQRLRPQLGENALALLQSPQAPPITSILTVLINDILAFEDAFTTVLDDYHLIETQPIHESLTFLIDHLPANMHLVMTTRIDPPIQLSRLRVHDQVTELRANDLRFSAVEAAAFLTQVMRLNLSADQITALEARTEGWIAGLQIAGLSMQGHGDVAGFIESFSGSHRHILGFLADEVLNQQPRNRLSFLLQTSILDRLCGPLCDAVTGESSGQAILEKLELDNLFIARLDDEGQWYRYHPLFGEVLRARLEGTQRDQIPELHRRASQWFEQSGQTPEAIDHLISGADFSRASDLITGIIQSYNNRGAVSTLVNWMSRLPEEQVFNSAELLSYQGWLLYLAGQVDLAKKHVQKAKAHITHDTPSVARGRLAYLSSQFAIAEGDMTAVNTYASEALELIGEQDPFFRILALMTIAGTQTIAGDTRKAIDNLREAARIGEKSRLPLPTLTAYAKLANQLNWHGKLQEGRAICRHAMGLYLDSSGQPSPISSIAFVEAAKLAYEEDDLDLLEPYIHTADKQAKVLGVPAVAFEIMYIQALFEMSMGNTDAALDLARQGRESAGQMSLKWYHSLFAALEADLSLRVGYFTAVEDWIKSADLISNRSNSLLHIHENLVYARCLVLQNRLSEAAELLAGLESVLKQVEYYRHLIKVLILKAQLLQRHNDSGQAMECLAEALRLAAPQNYRRVFLDEGEPIQKLLLNYQALIKNSISDGVDRGSIRLLTFTDELLSSFSNPISVNEPRPNSLPEPLSQRELDILQLIATGRSNKEIAEILVIAVSTVKSHINNLYGKLGTQRRTQAISIARDLGLLEERNA
ncbi:MAG TPA: LuxR C-terminal-related transcriptional regulator [Anaerolineales bacterium]